MTVQADFDWDTITSVFLDMDGTLLDLHFDNYFWLTHVPKRYAEKFNLDPEQAYDQLTTQFRQHEGQLNWYCLDFWSSQLDLDIVSLKREVEHKIAFRPNVIPFLGQLKTKRKRSVIVTNAHQASIALKIEKTALHQHVDRIICSHDLRAPKEAQTFWTELQRLEPFDPPSTLLIDDSVTVLRAAKEFGIGYLLAVQQPDSRQAVRSPCEFPALACFSDITPA